jgi:DUF971 family protein
VEVEPGKESKDLRPTDLRQSGPHELEIVWNDGHVSRYPVAKIRRSCRCAACVDEWSGKQLLKIDTIAEDIKPVTIEAVGNYAVHIDWSDGHRSGIFTFDHLRQICPCEECTRAE